jgi:outer membrane receptor protein involved in Fe transport
VTDALYAEARIGGYHSDGAVTSKSVAPRIADVGANTVSGGAGGLERLINRPQVNGSLSFQKSGWGGTHTLTIGGEYMSDRVDTTNSGYRDPCNCVSTLNNGVPTQVQIQTGTNVSKNDLTTAAGFVDDTFRVTPRLALSLGLRLDRYQPILPAQQGPTGEEFAAIDPVLTFKNWAPRLGMTADLTGDGKTVLKLHYGRFWVYPSPIFTAALNPNPPGWSRTYAWLDDADGNGRWSPGETGDLRSVSGGSTSTRLDPEIANAFAHQATAYVERFAHVMRTLCGLALW